MDVPTAVLQGRTESCSEPTDTNRNASVKYVLSGQPSGWAAMAKKVRESDEEKVRDTKEDIDTLLVFSGLFSAVLTAFLVESYQRLLPDTTAGMLATSSQTLAVMRQVSLQIADQSYRPVILDNGTVPQPFRPSSTDIRINVLWFSSLIFSLITASFGILVKQWLREYLAIANPSPHGRLRIRHYRYPGLKQWQVFEIAAVLPLLQQLALALFFIGLCYFTASVHESIGHTSLPLVSGWAFCFVTVTVLPLFRPRCPYKTTLLKSAFRAAHENGVRAARSIAGRLQRMKLGGRTSGGCSLSWLHGLLGSLQEYVVRNDESIIMADDAADLTILVHVDTLQSNDELLGTTLFECLQQTHDLKWFDTLKFVFHLLEHRLQVENLLSRLPGPLDLKTLSHSGYNGVIDILSHYWIPHFFDRRDLGVLHSWKPDEDTANWHVLFLLFSPSRYSLPDSGTRALREVMPYHGDEVIRTILRGYLAVGEPFSLSAFLETFLDRTANLTLSLTMSLRCFEAAMDIVFDNASSHLSHASYDVSPFTLGNKVSSWPWEHNIWDVDSRHYATRFVARIADQAVRNQDFNACHDESDIRMEPGVDMKASDSPASTEQRFCGAVACLWHMCYSAGEGFSEPSFRSVIHDCLSNILGTAAFVKALSMADGAAVIGVCSDSTLETTNGPHITEQMLQHLINVVVELTSAFRSGASQVSQQENAKPTVTHTLKLLCFVVHLVQIRTVSQHEDRWKKLLHASAILFCLSATDGITSSSPSHPVPDALNDDLVFQMVRSMQHRDDLNILAELSEACLEHIKWQELGEAEHRTVFDDQLLRAIGAIHWASHYFAHDDMSTLPRLARLEALGIVAELEGTVRVSPVQETQTESADSQVDHASPADAISTG